MKKSIIKLTLMLCLTLWVGTLVSQSGYSITISNASIQIRMDPGQEVSSSFEIGNNEGKPLSLSIGAADWRQTETGGLRLADPGTLERSMADWITISPRQFVLDVDSVQQIDFTINVPEGVTGTYWVGLLIEVEDETAVGTSGDTVGLAIGTNFLVKIFVDIIPGQQPNAQLKGVQQRGLNPLTMQVNFENTGNIQLEGVKGRVEIRNLEGDTIKSMPIREFSVLPGDVRNVLAIDQEAVLGETLAAGRYLALAVIDIGEDFLLGGQLVFEVKELALAPVGDAANMPQDLNGDGRYEDVNGDGQFNSDDIAFLEAHLNDPTVQSNIRAFDFDNDGQVTESDLEFMVEPENPNN